MRHGSLFSGIGGFDLAAEWMGWENVFSCEIEEFPRKVLQHHFPNTIHYEDIKRTDFSVHRGDIDILSGGFPCQPYSIAGKRLGKNDERHLWPEMYRAICEIAPRYVVGENVRGLVSWDGGLVLDEVYADLEAEGYEVGTFVLPAAGINAPHKRDRVWIVAHANSDWQSSESFNGEQRRGKLGQPAPNANKIGSQRKGRSTELEGRRFSFNDSQKHKADWKDFPTQPPVCGGDDGFPKGLDNLTVSAWEYVVDARRKRWRRESIKAYGNAIVPQLAYRIFKAIEQCQ